LALCLLGCGARTELLEPNPADASVSVHDAHHDVHEEAPPDAPDDVLPDVPSSPLCAVPDAGIAKTVCTNDAKVGIITSSMPSCYVDLVVHPVDLGARQVPWWHVHGVRSRDRGRPLHGHDLPVVGRLHVGERATHHGRRRERHALVHLRGAADLRDELRATVHGAWLDIRAMMS
jgi:hypothetical protein